ncbi:MAG: cobalamin biosynthesis protein P47K [Oscillospiraceae bacterium]|jgi:G3E family GTPase|nr:cobalamin biosynthesis protein P47K [Oscillospiraceae bacterium]
MSAMKAIILGGFLGSGKTTALMRFARWLAEHSASGRENKVMILENEVGEVGVDDAFLRGGGFAVDTLFSGCTCCTLSGELIPAVARIAREYDPEWLILETTGVAYPRLIQENLHHGARLDARIVVLADASRWNRLLLPMNALLRGQIEGSDAVLVNKTDLADEETLEKIERDILDFDPNAKIYRISALGEVRDDIWRGVAGVS